MFSVLTVAILLRVGRVGDLGLLTSIFSQSPRKTFIVPETHLTHVTLLAIPGSTSSPNGVHWS